MKRFIMIVLCMVFIAVQGQTDETDGARPIKRLVLAIGANNGGAGRVPLMYAVSDAGSFVNVITDMGGVSLEDCLFLKDPAPARILLEINQLQKRIDAARSDHDKVEVILYYSGHSDENNLLLRGEKLSYRDLKKSIDDLSADVRITILDSCASGAINRIKGGKKKAPFLVDRAYNMKGYAFITSSSADEAAQESDRIKASYFTHYLVSGLRGAADLSGDGRVSLSEAYQFAFQETLSQTRDTKRGPQHPNYDIDMSGTGDVIMTDIHKSSVTLTFSSQIHGRIFIYDLKGNLVVELNKPGDREIEIGLSQGKYRISNIRGGSLYETEIELIEGNPAKIVPAQLFLKRREQVRTRGETPDELPESGYLHPLRESFIRFSLFDLPEKNDPVRLHVAMSLVSSFCWELKGFGLSTGIIRVKERVKGMELGVAAASAGELQGVQLTAGINHVRGETRGIQIAAGGNFSGSLQGAQIAAGINLTGKGRNSLQLCGGANLAKEFGGVQLGVFNMAGSMQGLQLGVINLAQEVKGMQLGVINISGKSDNFALGVVNIYAKGTLDVQVWVDETGVGQFALKHGNRNNYNIWCFGSNFSNQQGVIGWGYGLPLFRREGFYMNMEILGRNIFEGGRWFRDGGLLASLRLLGGFSLGSRLSLFIGGSYNYFNSFRNEMPSPRPFYKSYLITGEYDRHWLGMFSGIQFRIL